MTVPSPAFLCTQALTEAGTPAPGLMGQTSIRTLAGVSSGGFLLSTLAGKSSNLVLKSNNAPDNNYSYIGATGGSSGTWPFSLDCQVTGGVAPYTYAWSRDPAGITITSGASTAVCSFSRAYPAGGNFYSGYAYCLVNDSSGKSATLTVYIEIEFSNG